MHLTQIPYLGVVKDTPNEAIASYDLSWITTGLNASFGRNPRYCYCDGCFDNDHLGQVLNQTGHSDVLLTASEKPWTRSKCIHQHPCNPIKPPNSWQHPCHPNIWQTNSMTMHSNSAEVVNSEIVQQLTADILQSCCISYRITTHHSSCFQMHITPRSAHADRMEACLLWKTKRWSSLQDDSPTRFKIFKAQLGQV